MPSFSSPKLFTLLHSIGDRQPGRDGGRVWAAAGPRRPAPAQQGHPGLPGAPPEAGGRVPREQDVTQQSGQDPRPQGSAAVGEARDGRAGRPRGGAPG